MPIILGNLRNISTTDYMILPHDSSVISYIHRLGYHYQRMAEYSTAATGQWETGTCMAHP
jgi:hypothetical protein